MSVHKASYLQEYGSIPDGMQLNHHCDNEKCIRPSHMYAGTAEQNRNDAKTRNRIASGERCGMAKLTKDDVIRIYKNIDKRSKTQLAEEYNVSVASISNIQNNKNWTSITSLIDCAQMLPIPPT